jgi:cellobiose phosphorylase
MGNGLWRFTDNQGSFVCNNAHRLKSLYFPLANERVMSSIAPDLHGDIKADEHSFLLEPVSRIGLVNSRSSRNFWVNIAQPSGARAGWSATGVSKDLKRIKGDKFLLEAGLLWHKITRENQEIGLRAEILSFVPASNEPVEIMRVTLTNISRKKISLIPFAAIPIYARAAHNIRDHRQVTSLLQRISLHKFGVIVKPTLIFDEKGHRPNKTNYFVLGWDEKHKAPQYIYPTQEMFCGEAGDLEAPEGVLDPAPPSKVRVQGRDAMGGLRFRPVSLRPRQSHTYIIVMGIRDSNSEIGPVLEKFATLKKVSVSLEETKNFWVKKSRQLGAAVGNNDCDNWLRWVSIQPALRRIFGCSYLPDFDYGKGGRGWRDLWQDCLALILEEPRRARKILVNNFGGVRIDGTNATIICTQPFLPKSKDSKVERAGFIADRNNISRVWMDHGVWPLLTLDLYLRETGDKRILFEQASYFCDPQIHRARSFDRDCKARDANKLKASSGKVYQGTILEHLLVENLVQFFNVGPHNHVRLEGADWNDGLDMARENGESVAFSCMYAHNLRLLAGIVKQSSRPAIQICREINLLLRKINYDSIALKQKTLAEYLQKAQPRVSGRKISLDSILLVRRLQGMSEWMARHIRKSEWLNEGFFNGYYDNKKQRVEGRRGAVMRLCLASQAFATMSGVAEDWQVRQIIKSVNRYLRDKELGGLHLNTDFKKEELHLGRAFSFVYGDKENGAFFNHMSVMYAYALAQRGFKKEAREVLSAIYRMAIDTGRSKIYPCLPEYFNLEGRGMYSYLTGSASWFLLTLKKFRLPLEK